MKRTFCFLYFFVMISSITFSHEMTNNESIFLAPIVYDFAGNLPFSEKPYNTDSVLFLSKMSFLGDMGKIGAGILNGFLGPGSFIMGDWRGGLIIAALELTGYALMYTSEDIYPTPTYPVSRHPTNPFFIAGLGLALAGTAYGFVRPWTHDRTKYAKPKNTVESISLAILPNNEGVDSIRLSYTYRY
ncbi:hypothetical protein AGMMS50267_05940 [Spirochaetia bacterium]|nr:hypothetical protein AGMMS50267_05940 [Spirochaetia bacterium]